MNFRGPIAQPDMDVPPPKPTPEEKPVRERGVRERSPDQEPSETKSRGSDAPPTVSDGPSDSISLKSLDPPGGNDSLLGVTLLEYDGLALFDVDVKYSVEVSPTLGFDYVPSPSLLADSKGLRDGASIETTLPIPGLAGASVNVGHGTDGSNTLGVGWGPPGPKGVSVGGGQVYAYTTCPDTGPCFDGGAKARLGPVAVKADVGVRLGPGYDAMAGDFGRAIIRALGLPIPAELLR